VSYYIPEVFENCGSRRGRWIAEHWEGRHSNPRLRRHGLRSQFGTGSETILRLNPDRLRLLFLLNANTTNAA
jgi:hypothetical protein